MSKLQKLTISKKVLKNYVEAKNAKSTKIVKICKNPKITKSTNKKNLEKIQNALKVSKKVLVLGKFTKNVKSTKN